MAQFEGDATAIPIVGQLTRSVLPGIDIEVVSHTQCRIDPPPREVAVAYHSSNLIRETLIRRKVLCVVIRKRDKVV